MTAITKVQRSFDDYLNRSPLHLDYMVHENAPGSQRRLSDSKALFITKVLTAMIARLALTELRHCLPVNITGVIVCASALCLNGCAAYMNDRPDREVASYQQRETASYHKPDGEVARYRERGTASYYARRFHNRRTASGERLNNNAMTAAHRTLPFGTEVIVKNVKNGKSVKVRINDRGPFVKGRIIDLTRAAFSQIASLDDGLTKVEIRIVR